MKIIKKTSPIVSIHTSVQDVTRTVSSAVPATYRFNPHIRTGCDDMSAEFGALPLKVSIHTSVQDVTNVSLPSCVVYCVSIHTSVQDVTEYDHHSYDQEDVSIHTSVQDVTNMTTTATTRRMFQSTHPYRM